VDVAVDQGKIIAIQKNLKITGEKELAGHGRLLVPGFVDLHMHLTMAFKESDEHEHQSLTELVKDPIPESAPTPLSEVMARTERVIKMAVRNGTTTIQSHEAVGLDHGATGLEALLQIREKVKPWVDIRIIVAPLGGFTAFPDGGEAQLRSAMKLGADMIGGYWYIDPDPRPYMDMLFRVAKDFNVDIDMHLDETNDPTQIWVETFAEKAIEHGWEGRVTASHICSLYWVTNTLAKRIIKKMVQARMKVVTNPFTNLYLRGKNKQIPTGPTRIKDLLDAGIQVGVGTDNTQDMFNPLSNADMLLAALFLAYQRRFGERSIPETAFNLITSAGAEMMKLDPGYGVTVGCQGDLVILDATTIKEALINQAARLYVIKNGKVVVDHGILISR
jgi:cytosine deaminase